jgi:hypothetical protein
VAAYPSAGVARSISRNLAAALSDISEVNQRARIESAIDSSPSARTLVARSSHRSGSPNLAVVHASTRRSTRLGSVAASHWPIAPPSESPQNEARAISSSSSRATTSRPRSSTPNGASESGEPP